MSDRRARFETEQSMSPWILWPTPVLLVGLAVWLAMRDDVPQALVWVMAGSAAIAFLASDEASYIHGQTLIVDGGMGIGRRD